MKSLLKLSAVALAMAIGSSAFAATPQTATFQATATLNSSCLLSATAVAFGTFTPSITANTIAATGTISSTCSNNVPYALSLNAGSNGTIAARQMAGGTSGNTDKLAYNLYKEVAYTNILGDGTTGVKTSLTGTGVAQTTTVYGKLDGTQFVTPDSYTDTITVTMAY